MKKTGLILLFLLLISIFNMHLALKATKAEKIDDRTLLNSAQKPNESISFDTNWYNIFKNEEDQTSKNSENKSSYINDERWNFENIHSWSNLTYIDGNKTRLIIGIDSQKILETSQLEDITIKYKGKIVNRISIQGEIKAFVVELPLEFVAKFVEEVNSKELTSYVEPNMKVQVQLVPNDTYWNLQWGPQKIEADWAWNTTIGSSEILVAFIDSGIDYTHPDLTENYIPLGYDWANNDVNPLDDFGHGTHCAGIVAAVLNNSLGIAGLAQVRVIAEKVLNYEGIGYYDWVAEGIIHATDVGVDIISISLGGYGESELIYEAIKYAYNSGVLIVAAAGNDNTNIKLYPAAYEEVIAVTATDQFDNVAWFSNYGEWVELAAPGVDIYSTMPTYHVTMNDWGYSMNYSYMSGTSMACPHVTGVVALIWSLYPNKTRDWIRLWLRQNTDDLGDPGFDINYGYGRVNARKTIEQTPPTHELIAYELITPPYVEPGTAGIINATILNFGENDEVNITLQLFANGTLVDFEQIEYLASGNISKVSISWIPSLEGLYNLTFYVVPVLGETSLENNVLWKYIYVGTPVRAVVLHSAGNVFGEILTNWQVLSNEWQLFGETMIYIDYTSLNKDEITYYDIVETDADVLIISCAYDPWAGWEFTDDEIQAIEQYVYEGHGLIATAGTLYMYVPNNNKLASLFGLDETVMWTTTGTDLLHIINTTHPLFSNIPNPLVFPYLGTSLPYDGQWNSNELVDGEYLALGHYLESAIVTRRGLVYISPWLEVIPPYYHHHLQLLYNAITWSRYQKPEHELVVSLNVPSHLEPRESTLINATVTNNGLNNETAVEFYILINGEVVNSTTVSVLPAESSFEISYLWTPITEGTFNVTAYAPPITGETLTTNNKFTKLVNVMFPIRVAVLGDYASQLTNLLLENGIIAEERDWDVIENIYDYKAIVINKPYDPGESTFLTFIETADLYNVGLVFTSSWPSSSRPYGISLLQWYLSDPEGQDDTFGEGSVYYKISSEHPIFEGWSVGEKIYIITAGDRDHAWFWGYSGETISNIGNDATGIKGGGIAYKIQETGNKHLLLAGLAPQFYTNLMHWTSEAKLIFVRGVLWVVSKYGHDLAVNLEAPQYAAPGSSIMLNASVRNAGLENETNVELHLLIEGEVVNSTTITELQAGTSHTITYQWTPTIEGVYNITAYASPVENETLLVNNKATSLVNIMRPLIQTVEGQYANYRLCYIDLETGEEVFVGLWNFTYFQYISPQHINITFWVKDFYNYSQTYWMIVNIFNRIVEEDSGIYWAGMYYPGLIETNITIGSTINLLWNNVTITDSTVIIVNGLPIDCWEVLLHYYDYIYKFWYAKASGLWIGMKFSSPNSVGYLLLTETNIPTGFEYEHDIAVTLEAPSKLAPETSVLLNATIYNTGLSNETNVTLQLMLNDEQVESWEIPELNSSDYYSFSFPWTPLAEGTFNVTVYSPPVEGEEYVDNNINTKTVNVYVTTVALISDDYQLTTITYILDGMKINYDMYNSNSFYLYTADLDLLLNYRLIIFNNYNRMITTDEHTALTTYLSLGGNLIVTGYDSLGNPEDSLLADIVRSATVGDNVGEPDLYVVDAAHPIMQGPYGNFSAGYHISGLYSDCDVAEANAAQGAVTVAELADGYDKIIATEGLLGKVVYWNGRGENDWMMNSDCQAMFQNMVHWMIMPMEYEHELKVDLDAPSFLDLGDSTLLNATVYNLGLNNETSVELQLWIDNNLEEIFSIPELSSGNFSTFSLEWTPPTSGIYNITAYVPPVVSEEIISNNKVTKMVYVGLPPNIPAVYVVPSFTNTTLNEIFTVNVNVASVSDLFGYEFQLFFENTILECQNITIPSNHFLEPEDPDNLFIVKLECDNQYNATHGRIWVAMILLAPENPKSGSGTFVSLILKAIAPGTSKLAFFNTKLADSSGSPIVHIAVDGYVQIEMPEANRDVALTAVNTSLTEVYEGWNLQIFVVAINLGNITETFDVTLYYGNNSIGTQTITDLAPNEEAILIFNWNTSGVELYINHSIWAEATSLSGETNLENNIFIDGTVTVKITGDINGDEIIDIYDVVLVGASFGTQSGDPLWDVNTDINQDDIIDIFDIVLVVINLGKEH